MAVKMRLRREGKRKQPFYRVVVADARAPRDGRFIEDIGFYQPLHEPSTISIDRERALYWLGTGVQPTESVVALLRIEGIWQEYKPGDTGKDRSAKHQAREAAAAAKAKAAAEREAADAKRLADARAQAVAAEAPVAEEPPAEEPVAEAPAAEEPVAEAPAAEEPVAEEPAADKPAAEEPAEEA